ncbi:MAG: helix-turn-helix transcriptional regulator [Corallococcus sp.]|nr:helix-turn-helix transcriptional regulator [Corallococcus sp.]
MGNRIKVIMRDFNMTNQQMASISGKSARTVREWKSNPDKPIESDALLKIADALNITIDYILGKDEYENKNPKSYFMVTPDEYKTVKFLREHLSSADYKIVIERIRSFRDINS